MKNSEKKKKHNVQVATNGETLHWEDESTQENKTPWGEKILTAIVVMVPIMLMWWSITQFDFISRVVISILSLIGYFGWRVYFNRQMQNEFDQTKLKLAAKALEDTSEVDDLAEADEYPEEEVLSESSR